MINLLKKLWRWLFMDDPKKKKADGKRIALTQKHERTYMKRICLEQKEILENQEGRYIYGESLTSFDKKCSKAKLIRITKCCLKLMKKYEEEHK